MMIINKTIYIVGIFEIYLKKKSGHLPVSAGQLMEWWENAAENGQKIVQRNPTHCKSGKSDDI